MFPIGDENRGAKELPIVTIALVAINVLVFLYQSSLTVVDLRQFIYTYGVIPAEIERGIDTYTLFTSMFVHGGLAHIAGNMLFLWIFGDNIERRFGSVLYLLFYLGTGLAASYAHILTNSGSLVPSVGASGAISGVMGAYILLYPFNRVLTFIWYLGIISVPAIFYLGFWFITQFINGMLALNVATAQNSGVAFWAHIGGFVAGLAAAVVLGALRPERKPKRQQQIIFPQERERWHW